MEECERYFKAQAKSELRRVLVGQILTNEIDWKNQLVTVKGDDGAHAKVDEPRRTLFMSDPGAA